MKELQITVEALYHGIVTGLFVAGSIAVGMYVIAFFMAEKR
jgi:hypothetical protein